MKKNIAIISDHASPLAHLGGVDSGGQNVYVDQIAKHLSRLGYDVDIFTRWDNARLPQVIQYQENIRIVHVKAGPKKFIPKEKILYFADEFYSHMLSFIRDEEKHYHLIHANFFISGDIAHRLKKKLAIPYAITFHALGKVRRYYQGEQDGFPNKRFAIEKKIIDSADLIIAECPQDREDLISFYHADSNKISIIPCGFDPHELYPIDKLVARITVGLDSKETYILQLGRMVPRKGIDTVVEALALLKKRYKRSVKLLIVGGESEIPDAVSTPEIGRLQQKAKELEVVDDVIFIGRRGREQLKYYYNAVDIFISTPWYEPFGITPLEAMACGTPVIGSSVGGIQFTVKDGQTGFLVSPKNPLALSEKIEKILTDNELAHTMGENGIKRVNTFFTWGTVVQALSSSFEKIIYSKITTMEEYEMLQTTVSTNFDNLLDTVNKSKEQLKSSITRASLAISGALNHGGKVFLCGNGGSASQAQHFAAELVGHFKLDAREPLPFLSLTTDTAILTAIANDFSFEDIFARQVDAYGQSGDVLIAMSTSGNSPNILKALLTANKKNMICIGFTGKNGGKMVDHCDISLIVPSDKTQHIQEIHGHILHSISELIELKFSDKKSPIIPVPLQGLKNGISSKSLSPKSKEDTFGKY